MALFGSLEYELAWKHSAVPLGLPILQRRASARRISGNAFGGWPTPDSSHHGSLQPEKALARVNSYSDGQPKRAANLEDVAAISGWPTPDAHAMNVGADPEKHLARLKDLKQKHGNGNGAGLTLGACASMAGWRTPKANDATSGPCFAKKGTKRGTQSLGTEAALAGWPTPMGGSPGTENYNAAGNTDSSRKTTELLAHWPTPSSRDWKDTLGMSTTGTNPDGSTRVRLDQLPRVAALALHGTTTTSSPAATEKRGALNPAFTLWLMGFPKTWMRAGCRAMARFSRSRKK